MNRRTIATASFTLEKNRTTTFKIEEVKESTNRKAFDNLLKKMEEEKNEVNFNPEIKEVFNKYFSSFEKSFFYNLTISIRGENGEEYNWIEKYGSALEAYKEMLEFLEGSRGVPCSLEDFKENNPSRYKYRLRHYFEFGINCEKHKKYREEKMRLWKELPIKAREAYIEKLLLSDL